MSNELWCIYIAGPDDLVAMPSKAVAEAVARNFNAVYERYGAERGHDVRAVAHAEAWMHGKAAHTDDLRKSFWEYADLVLDEGTVPAAQQAAEPDVDDTNVVDMPADPVEQPRGGGFARRVAEAIEAHGWATGGDFYEDFLPDVENAVSVALAEGYTPSAQPKPEQPRGEVLDAPAKVGAVVLGRGVPWESVIACAQRAYAYKDDFKITPEQGESFRNAVTAQPKPEQAVGDGVVAYAIVDPSDMEIEQLCTSKDELEQWRVEGTEIVPLCFATTRPAVATPVEVTADDVINSFHDELHDVFVDCEGEITESAIRNALERAISKAGKFPVADFEIEGGLLTQEQRNVLVRDARSALNARATPVEVTEAMAAAVLYAYRAEVGTVAPLDLMPIDTEAMRVALAAHPHTGYSAVPEGWKLVPVEPTKEMLDAVCSSDGYEPWTDGTMTETYKAMLAAAPEVPRG